MNIIKRILRVVIGVPVFFIMELFARIYVPLKVKSFPLKKKLILQQMAKAALDMKLVTTTDYQFRSFLNRIGSMDVEFRRIIDIVFCLADPETEFEDTPEVYRLYSSTFVGLLIELLNDDASATAYTVDLKTVMEERQDSLNSDFDFNWVGKLTDRLSFVDIYYFFQATGLFKTYMVPVEIGETK